MLKGSLAGRKIIMWLYSILGNHGRMYEDILSHDWLKISEGIAYDSPAMCQAYNSHQKKMSPMAKQDQ